MGRIKLNNKNIKQKTKNILHKIKYKIISNLICKKVGHKIKVSAIRPSYIYGSYVTDFVNNSKQFTCERCGGFSDFQ